MKSRALTILIMCLCAVLATASLAAACGGEEGHGGNCSPATHGVIAGIIAITLVVVVVLYFRCRKMKKAAKKKKKAKQEDDSEE